jgi:Flp pilus assembly protein TadB
MSPLAAAALGALAGVAIWAALTVLVPAKPDLAKTLGALTIEAEGTTTASPTPGAVVVASRLGLLRAQLRADLDVLDQTPGVYVRRLLRLAGVAAATPVAVAFLLAAFGIGVSPVLVLLGAFAFGLLAWASVEIETHTKAERARTEAARALSTVLSLTAMALSGGAGIDSALRAAASAGTGLAFTRIKHALDRAALLSMTPWETLGELGERLDSSAYIQLASTTALAGTEGARIRTSLDDRATAMRGQRLADIETEALASTERMSLPIVAMATSFVLIVGYPALQRIMTGL